MAFDAIYDLDGDGSNPKQIEAGAFTAVQGLGLAARISVSSPSNRSSVPKPSLPWQPWAGALLRLLACTSGLCNPNSNAD